MSTAIAPSVTRDSSRLRRVSAAAGQKYALIVVFAAIVGLFSVLNPEIFPTASNAQTIASTQATVALLALAAMLPLVVGQFDISVGYQFGLAQGLCAHLIVNEGLPAGAAIGVVLAAGAVIGLVNGVLVAKVKLNSFVATSIRPGRFNAVGTLIAVYLVATGITGLQQEGAQPFVQQLFNGAALLIAVTLARLSRKSS